MKRCDGERHQDGEDSSASKVNTFTLISSFGAHHGRGGYCVRLLGFDARIVLGGQLW